MRRPRPPRGCQAIEKKFTETLKVRRQCWLMLLLKFETRQIFGKRRPALKSFLHLRESPNETFFVDSLSQKIMVT
jgi:hypothetical protein